MADDLEYEVDNMSGSQLEKLLPGFLRARGYEVRETNRTGKDGGVDAYVSLGDASGIAHASVRQDWRRKLRDDASKVKDLEDDGKEITLLVYFTNQSITEPNIQEMNEEIMDEYDWRLEIFHKPSIIGTLESDAPGLAYRYLDVDLNRDQDHLDEIQEILSTRIDTIQSRDDFTGGLQPGPVAVLHLVPSGIASGSSVERVEDLPNPPIWGHLTGAHSPYMNGDAKYCTNARSETFPSYTYLRTDGLFEAVTTTPFGKNEGDKFIFNNNQGRRVWLDRDLALTAKAGLNRLQKIGFNGNIHAVITLIGIDGFRMTVESRTYELAGIDYPRFKSEKYQTRMVDTPVSAGDYDHDGHRIVVESHDMIYDCLEPLITQYWQQAGHKDGCPYFDDDRDWIGPEYSEGT
ncbi:restriction endonuclease [Halococcus sp. IIIV-5B]|uniref:restriction endonuclease n=1 Tax=Halococcus sp. IIIV-5B TaxID=2321230 RepID=UPI000E740147|nr:restriction endonuclease [Halococcus sp. IIIV-5B]RJT07485.1 hypothetical protein D3261_02460 [Halococcus sp. IIIV-5B]